MTLSAKLAVGIVIIGINLALVLSVLSIAEYGANVGLQQAQGKYNENANELYDQYDQTVVSGSVILDAVNIFKSEPVAIVVRTIPQMDASLNTGINYGALLSGTDMGTYVTNQLSLNNSPWFTSKLLSVNGSNISNTNFYPLTDSGTNTEVRVTARFNANLIKSPNEEIIGICFTQQ